MNKIKYLVLILIFSLTACSSSQVATVEATLDPVKEATLSVQHTIQALLSEIRSDESDLEKTEMPIVVAFTPLPTHTPRPENEPTPTVSFDRSMKSLDGFIIDQITEDRFSFPVITVTDVRVYHNLDNIEEGEIVAQIQISMHNPGTTPASYGSELFQVFDANGIGHDTAITFSDECEMEYDADVFPGGTLDGCLEFIIPKTSQKFDLVYAPYNFDRFGDGRFIKWEISYPLPSFPPTISVQITRTDPLDLKQNLSESLIYNLPSRIFGEMQYLGKVPLKEIRLEGIFYNDKDQIVNEDEGSSWQNSVLPGEKILYSFSSVEDSNITRAELTITAKVLEPIEITYIYREFEVVDFQLKPTSNGDYKMLGTVHNIGDRSVYGVGVSIIAYDRLGNIIGLDQGTAGYELDVFEPGSSSPIDGYMRIKHPEGMNAVDHFEFIFEAFAFSEKFFC